MEMYHYIKELHTFIEHQAKKLQNLERSVKELQQEIIRLKERPPVQVGNIEYKFDQLKVETLEGTLNIGLNPSDLDGVSDFSVDQQQVKVPPPSPKKLFKKSMEIENQLRDYLDLELPAIIQSAKEKLNFTVIDDSYDSFIKEDILKQLPTRISSHLNGLDGDERDPDEGGQQIIIEKIKAEIGHGVYLFLEQLQKQTKEEQQ